MEDSCSHITVSIQNNRAVPTKLYLPVECLFFDDYTFVDTSDYRLTQDTLHYYHEATTIAVIGDDGQGFSGETYSGPARLKPFEKFELHFWFKLSETPKYFSFPIGWERNDEPKIVRRTVKL